jgi:transcriptional regulator with XRE-family HTH domain
MSEELGMKVRSELFRRKMSQKELAGIIGITPVYLSDIIRGRKTGPKAQEHVKRIKKVLSI